MKLKLRLALIISSLMALVITALSVMLLSRTRSLQIRMAMDNMKSSSGLYAEKLDVYYEEYMSAAAIMAQIMGDYQNVDPGLRRQRYTEELRALITQNQNFFGIYALWAPGLPDGMDERYRNAPGCDEDGSFAPFYSRETGRIELETMPDHKNIFEKFSGRQEVSNPEEIAANGASHFIVHFRAPAKDADGRVIGLVGVIANFDYSKELIRSIKPYGTGRAELYTANGTIVASHEEELTGSRFQNVKTGRFGQTGIAALENSMQSENPVLVSNGGLLIQGYPFRIGEAADMWLFISSVPVNDVLKEVDGMTRFSIIIAIVSLLLAVSAGLVAAYRIAMPISGVALTLKDISEGEGDLTRNITVKRKDEIGSLARYFNLTLEKIRNLIITIKKLSANLFDTGSELSSNMNETAAAINEITANIQSIKTRVVNQSASVTQTNSAMEQISARVDQLNSHIESLSAGAVNFSSAIEEMIANIQSVTATLIKNTDNMKNLSEASEAGRASVQEAAMDIQEIARESKSLLEINEVMENIASQTNLLSMNAAIEASHAGEAGKGFAVVAGEIRKLAESSSEQSKTISEGVKRITGSIDKISASTAKVLDKFEAVDSGVKIVSGQEARIRGAMEEQTAGSQQIMETTGSMNDIIRMVKDSVAGILDGSKEVIQESRKLEMVTQEISAGMNEMAAGADQINAAVNEVNDISNRNKENINALTQEVSRFKVEG